MTSPLEATIANLTDIAAELERAAHHARTAAKHFQDREVPRGCAHILAAEGHIVKVRRALDVVVETHAARATP